ncbi:hypothetical protein CVT24_003576 [Panaeolus cyanescens]|uniref:ATP-dependent DNA helicase PIF1 n=1 Tax=Panaeolus cyanescens TaxID=181874 RepID=A0A409Y7J2_9AGAR|nr:hypothetical protein CVT24_003576 [Panaeolus cyanescens]
MQSSKPQSGLGTVRRDWSASSVQASSSIEIPWSPTQRPSTKPPTPAPSRPLTGSEQRLKAIQDALSGMSSSSSSSNKRSSPDENTATAGPVKRARQLPADWHDVMVQPSMKPAPGLSRTTSNSRLFSAADSSKNVEPSSSRSSSDAALTALAQRKKGIASMFLSAEQTEILNLVKAGDSVFYTGSAGTGKSVLLREIIKTLRKLHVKNSDAVAITASTGIAACNIGGVTIHSFAGIGLGLESAEDLVVKIKKNKKAATRWMRTKVLIIDEVSMVDGELFDKLAQIAKMLKKKELPFGGIQVIVTGDFFQLPPVTKSGDATFAFEAKYWKESIKHTFNLTQVFRQKDTTFVNMLNEMRFGTLSTESISKFRSLSRHIHYNDGINATELFPRREDVERSNDTRMRSLQTQEKVFTAKDGGSIPDRMQKEKMLQNFMAPSRLVLRVDAQVMLIKNVDETLVNGSMGRVVAFLDPAAASKDPEYAFDLGVIGASGTGTAGGKQVKAASISDVYPLVEFISPHGVKRRMLVLPEVWKVELPNGEVQVSRTQVSLPLILSWAMSIHKSQGQTLDRVKVDLGKVFEKGQAYVALSRATTLEGLQVLNFDPNKVKAHPKVVAWSKTLATVPTKS